jgi:hypothetical protein
MNLSEFSARSSRVNFIHCLQIAAGFVLAGFLTACGGGSSSSAVTTSTPPPSCSGQSAAAPPAFRPAIRAAATTPQAFSPISPAYFGMHIDVGLIGNPPTLPWPFAGLPSVPAGTTPFGTIRMMSTETRWSDIDSGNGNYDFSTLDQWRQLYAQNEPSNGNYNVIFVLYSTPGYISSNPSDSCVFAGNTSGHTPGSCDPPADVCSDGTGTDAAFTNFVTAVAQHVQGDNLPKIKYWEVWNEPNDVTFWNGTLPQLARMAQDAQCVIEGTNCNSLTTYSAQGVISGAQMLSPPPVTSNDETNTSLNSDGGWLAGYLAAGGGQYADIIDFHGYVQDNSQNGNGQAEGVFNLAQSVMQSVSATGSASKPVWDSEIGFSPTVITDPYTQASWLARAYLLQAGLGVQNVDWFEFGATNVGVLYTPGATISNANYDTAGLDYPVLSSWLVGSTPTGPCTSAGTVWTCGFTLSGGAPAEAVWDTSQTCTPPDGPSNCTFSTFTPGSPYTTYSDLQGDPPQSISGTIQVGIEPVWLQ